MAFTEPVARSASALLVERHPAVRALLHGVLEDATMAELCIHSVASAHEADRYINGCRIALVDIDFDAPSAVHLLGRLEPDCWKLAVTLRQDSEWLARAFDVGAHGMLVKHESYEQQVERLQFIVRGHGSQGASAPGISVPGAVKFRSL